MLLFNLGLLGAALAGGIKGAGKGMVQLADEETERLKQERIQEFKLQENEQTARLHYDLGDRNAANQQSRGLLDYAAKKKIDIGMATDPNNVKAATDAELQAQRAKDQYTNEQFPTKLNQEKQLFDMKNPLEREKIQSQIDENKAQIANFEKANAGDPNKHDIEYLKLANSAVEKKFELVSNMPANTEEEIHARDKALLVVNQEMASIRSIINQKMGIVAPDGDQSALPSASELAALQEKFNKGKENVKPSRVDLEKAYLQQVSYNKSYVKTLSDDEIIAELNRVKSEQSALKAKNKTVVKEPEKRMLPVPKKSSFMSTREGGL